MIINFSKPDPDDPNNFIEGERSRRARQTELTAQVESDGRRAKRAARLDKYFSQHPPNGPLLSIFRSALEILRNTNGEMVRWLTYEHLEASFARLQKSGILEVEVTEDKLGIKTFHSHATGAAMAKRRNVRPPEIDTLVRQLKSDLGDFFQQPRLTPTPPVHGCRYVPVIDKWRVSLYFGGHQRALGCYPFETAIRLQDVLTFHFSTYRQSASYNTSEQEARELLGKHLFLQAFVSGLETHWLASGVLQKHGVDKTEERWKAIESRLTALEAKTSP